MSCKFYESVGRVILVRYLLEGSFCVCACLCLFACARSHMRCSFHFNISLLNATKSLVTWKNQMYLSRLTWFANLRARISHPTLLESARPFCDRFVSKRFLHRFALLPFSHKILTRRGRPLDQRDASKVKACLPRTNECCQHANIILWLFTLFLCCLLP